MTHLEIEYKHYSLKTNSIVLTVNFHTLHRNANEYYFDSDNFDMKAHRMSLRIRTLPNRAKSHSKFQRSW